MPKVANLPGPFLTQRVNDIEDVRHELLRLERTLRSLPVLAMYFERWDVVPAKPVDGMTVYADGTNWNPGGGEGIYTYYAAAWNRLG